MDTKKEITVIDQIFSNYQELFDAEKRVADYVTAHSETVIDMTVSEVADACEVSKATIVRFCKKCGCKGFHHLKIKMARETVESQTEKVSNEIDTANIGQSVVNILANKYDELKQTLLNVDTKVLEEILRRVKQARLVVFAAVGNTIPIALDGAYKFNELGITSLSSTIWENQLAAIHTLTPDDVVIAISASGESKNLLRMADAATRRGAAVIAITNHARSALALKSKFHIHTVSRERLFFQEFSFNSTRLAAMAVIETIYFLLASSKTDSRKFISTHEQSMAEDKI